MTFLQEEVCNQLTNKRFELGNEMRLQGELNKVLIPAFPSIQPEYKLGPKSRVDYLLNGLAIEIKVKGNPMDVFKQLERYASSQEVKELLLITSKSFKMPDTIGGKPCAVFYLSRAWL